MRAVGYNVLNFAVGYNVLKFEEITFIHRLKYMTNVLTFVLLFFQKLNLRTQGAASQPIFSGIFYIST